MNKRIAGWIGMALLGIAALVVAGDFVRAEFRAPCEVSIAFAADGNVYACAPARKRLAAALGVAVDGGFLGDAESRGAAEWDECRRLRCFYEESTLRHGIRHRLGLHPRCRKWLILEKFCIWSSSRHGEGG
jgi:hypothetical protein